MVNANVNLFKASGAELILTCFVIIVFIGVAFYFYNRFY